MAKTYTLTEIAELLDVDAKTLRRWVKLEEFNLSQQTSKYDKRIKWLTEEQAAKLAKVHERAWPPRPKSPAQAETQAGGLTGAVNMLREQVADLKADHVGTAQFTNTVKMLTERLDALERGYNSQLDQMTHALIALKELRDWKDARESKPRMPRQSAGASAATELAPGLVGALTFAELHHINAGTAKSAWQSGRIATIRGNWKQGRTAISIALDAQGRAQFYELYSGHHDFQPCPDCPHTDAGQQIG